MNDKKYDVQYMDIDSLIPYVNNPRKNDQAVDAVASSIINFGFKNPIVVDANNEIINGHTRLKAAKKLGLKEVPVIVADDLTEDQVRAFRLADNKVAELADWDEDMLKAELSFIDMDMESFGFDLFETLKDRALNNPTGTSLIEDFGVPPLSILDTRQGRWQDRKRFWKSLGIKSEVGREYNLVYTKNLDSGNLNGTSIFDPVLCELGYLWFTPGEGSLIVDCFAGGSVRGVVAERLGFDYIGCDLRQEQVDANYANAQEIGCNMANIQWICDDSQNILDHIEPGTADLLFTCPPYFDLEVYSDNDKDISNMDYEAFAEIYKNILQRTAKTLKDNRFAIVTISDVRDKKGFYRGLTGLTKQAFEEVGLKFYNDIILINQLGTSGLRARRFMGSRKVVRTHQNVLVFYKGDPKKIKDNFKTISGIDFEGAEELED